MGFLSDLLKPSGYDAQIEQVLTQIGHTRQEQALVIGRLMAAKGPDRSENIMEWLFGALPKYGWTYKEQIYIVLLTLAIPTGKEVHARKAGDRWQVFCNADSDGRLLNKSLRFEEYVDAQGVEHIAVREANGTGTQTHAGPQVGGGDVLGVDQRAIKCPRCGAAVLEGQTQWQCERCDFWISALKPDGTRRSVVEVQRRALEANQQRATGKPPVLPPVIPTVQHPNCLQGNGTQQAPFVIEAQNTVESATVQAEIVDGLYGPGTYQVHGRRLYYPSTHSNAGEHSLCEHRVQVNGRETSVWFDLYRVGKR